MTARPAVVFLNRFYWPDVAATAQMLADLAEDLAASGWDVRVITSRGPYASGDRLPLRESHAGVQISRIRGTAFGRGSVVGRLMDYASYVAGALLAIARVPHGSIIVGMTDPPLIAMLAVLGARLCHGKAVYWVQDLFPDVATELGVIRANGVVHGALGRIAAWLYRRCDLVVALGPAMAEALRRRGVRAERLVVIHNWADSEAIVPIAPGENRFAAAHQLRDQFVVLYSGNAGRAHVFDAVCAAMRSLAGNENILFVFVGGGHRTQELKAFVAQHGLHNARFLDYAPRDELAHSLSAAGVSLVTEDPRVVGLLVPSKTYGILASGRPILFVGGERSDVAAIVRAFHCGAVVDPADSAGLTAMISRLSRDPQACAAMGARARAAAVAEYGRTRSTGAWSNTLSLLASSALAPTVSRQQTKQLPPPDVGPSHGTI